MLNGRTGIEIFSLHVDEPVTVLTDLLISAVCFVAFYRLSRIPWKPRFSVYLSLFFVFLGTGTLLGSILGHGFYYAVSPFWRLPGWCCSMISIALIFHASVLLLGDYPSGLIKLSLICLNLILLTVFIILASVRQDFIFVVAYISILMLFGVGGTQLLLYSRLMKSGSGWMLLGIGTAFLANIVFLMNIDLGKWLRVMDLSHVILAVSVWFFYRGTRSFMDQANVPE